MSMLAMHSEEFNTKTGKQKHKVEDLDLKVNQIEYEKDHINMDIKELTDNVAKLTQLTRDLSA